MDIQFWIGIDIAKLTLDWAVYQAQGIQLRIHSSNTVEGIRTALKKIAALQNWDAQQAVFCMEHTGIYNAHLLESLLKSNLAIWLESSLQIKQAGGMQRGKNDSIDAQRIAEYAFRFQDRLQLWQPPRLIIQQLAYLSAARQRIIQAYNLLAGPIIEQESFVHSSFHKQVKQSSKNSLEALKKEQKAINQKIDDIIAADERLKEIFELIISVPGVGAIIAKEVIIATNEMNTINDPKKMACHSGVAPFEYRSGTSIRGKTRVSHQARKRLKSLFHLGAMSAIRSKGEIQDYYLRKVSEGKNKMLPGRRAVLNAVRNKLIHRIFAVVKRKEKYNKNYTPILV